MTPQNLFRTLFALLLAPAALGAQEPAIEIDYRALFHATPIELAGRVLAENGAAVAGAQLTLGGSTVTSAADGSFLFTGLPRHNELLRVTAAGYREANLGVHLLRPLSETRVTLRPVLLTPSDPSTVRFLFGGDVSFGRRFLDPGETAARDAVPADDPDALILASDPLPGSKACVDFVRPYFQAADFGVVNFETPVTDDPSTPHPDKDFVFFTLPGSLPALSYLGVDYVSLGNNHVYDYLDQGLADTLQHVTAAGIPHSGAGLDDVEAFQSYRTTLGGQAYGFVSASSVSGSQWPINYVAEPGKGGSADLRDDTAVTGAITAEIGAGYLPIAVLHTGQEYTFEPSSFAADRIAHAVGAGAGLVIAHHPHVAQGFEFQDGTFVVHSLGNFVFDQARLETMVSVLAEVDMNGASMTRARGLPIYLEDFRPRPVAGALADVFLRRLGEFSRGGAVAFPYNGQAVVVPATAGLAVEETTVPATVTIPASGWTVVDLRGLAPTSSWLVSAAASQAAVSGRLGRDLFDGHADFEDYDTDADDYEVSRWDVESSSKFPCLHDPYRGAVAVCSVRDSGNVSDSVVPFRNRTRVMGDTADTPNKDLTLFGYIRGSNAGPVRLNVKYYASAGSATFGAEDFDEPGGTFAWRPFMEDLSMPADTPGATDHSTQSARALRVFFFMSPPAAGDALVSYDEVAAINWEPAGDLSAGMAPAGPHPFQFLRVEGSPGTVDLELTFRGYAPDAVNALFVDGFESGDASAWSTSLGGP